jgi:hypothetical protein
MGYIPQNAKWYLAEIVEEISIEDEAELIAHINLVLVRADSPEEAYEGALGLGRQHNISYLNTDGKEVQCVFRGLHDLNIIHDELEHGAEIIYEKREGLNQQQMAKLVKHKGDLGIFK